MVYEALNNLAPDNVKDLFKNVSDTHNRNTRSVDKALLHIPRFQTSSFENSFSALEHNPIRSTDIIQLSVKNHSMAYSLVFKLSWTDFVIVFDFYA